MFFDLSSAISIVNTNNNKIGEEKPSDPQKRTRVQAEIRKMEDLERAFKVSPNGPTRELDKMERSRKETHLIDRLELRSTELPSLVNPPPLCNRANLETV